MQPYSTQLIALALQWGIVNLAETSKGNRGFPSQNSLEQGEKGLEKFKGDSPRVSAGVPELSQTSHTDIAVCDFFTHRTEILENMSARILSWGFPRHSKVHSYLAVAKTVF